MKWRGGTKGERQKKPAGSIEPKVLFFAANRTYIFVLANVFEKAQRILLCDLTKEENLACSKNLNLPTHNT